MCEGKYIHILVDNMVHVRLKVCSNLMKSFLQKITADVQLEYAAIFIKYYGKTIVETRLRK